MIGGRLADIKFFVNPVVNFGISLNCAVVDTMPKSTTGKEKAPRKSMGLETCERATSCKGGQPPNDNRDQGTSAPRESVAQMRRPVRDK